MFSGQLASLLGAHLNETQCPNLAPGSHPASQCLSISKLRGWGV